MKLWTLWAKTALFLAFGLSLFYFCIALVLLAQQESTTKALAFSLLWLACGIGLNHINKVETTKKKINALWLEFFKLSQGQLDLEHFKRMLWLTDQKFKALYKKELLAKNYWFIENQTVQHPYLYFLGPQQKKVKGLISKKQIVVEKLPSLLSEPEQKIVSSIFNQWKEASIFEINVAVQQSLSSSRSK